VCDESSKGILTSLKFFELNLDMPYKNELKLSNLNETTAVMTVLTVLISAAVGNSF
jgi:hypothetical protein